MGRPPSNGGPSFRFNAVEVAEMEAMLQAHHCTVPAREVLDALAQRFSSSAERSGKLEVSGKQVWNWFQNRRYALRAKAARVSVPVQVNMPVVAQHDQSAVRNVSQVSQHQPLYYQDHHQPATTNTVRSTPPVSHPTNTPSAKSAGSNASENSVMEFEAKSARDGAWYDVASFLSYRALESADPEALVRFAGFGSEEDEWVNIRRHVRQRSLPCESSECVAVLPGDLILCFQEGKEQALYFDAHVLDAQRRRHDVRGCRCRFLVRYDHDQSEEIVPLRKICRRPETDYRLQQLHGMSANVGTQKPGMDAKSRSAVKVDASGMVTQKQLKHEEHADTGYMTTIPIPDTPFNESALPSAATAAASVTPSGESPLPSAINVTSSVPSSGESALPSATNASSTIPLSGESPLPSAINATSSVPSSGESALPSATNACSTIPLSGESPLPSAINATSSVPSSGESALPSAANASSTIPLSGESPLPSAINATSSVPSSGESALPSATNASSTIPLSGESALPCATNASSTVPPSDESAFPPSANATSSVSPSGESALPSPTSRVTPSSELALLSSANATSCIPPSSESTLTCATIGTTSVACATIGTTSVAPSVESALPAAATTNAPPSVESAFPGAASTNAAPSGESSLVLAATAAAANITSTSESVTPPPAAQAAISTSTSESVMPPADAPAANLSSTGESVAPTTATPTADVTTGAESTAPSSIGPNAGIETDVGILNLSQDL